MRVSTKFPPLAASSEGKIWRRSWDFPFLLFLFLFHQVRFPDPLGEPSKLVNTKLQIQLKSHMSPIVSQFCKFCFIPYLQSSRLPIISNWQLNIYSHPTTPAFFRIASQILVSASFAAVTGGEHSSYSPCVVLLKNLSKNANAKFIFF